VSESISQVQMIKQSLSAVVSELCQTEICFQFQFQFWRLRRCDFNLPVVSSSARPHNGQIVHTRLQCRIWNRSVRLHIAEPSSGSTVELEIMALAVQQLTANNKKGFRRERERERERAILLKPAGLEREPPSHFELSYLDVERSDLATNTCFLGQLVELIV